MRRRRLLGGRWGGRGCRGVRCWIGGDEEIWRARREGMKGRSN